MKRSRTAKWRDKKSTQQQKLWHQHHLRHQQQSQEYQKECQRYQMSWHQHHLQTHQQQQLKQLQLQEYQQLLQQLQCQIQQRQEYRWLLHQNYQHLRPHRQQLQQNQMHRQQSQLQQLKVLHRKPRQSHEMSGCFTVPIVANYLLGLGASGGTNKHLTDTPDRVAERNVNITSQRITDLSWLCSATKAPPANKVTTNQTRRELYCRAVA